MAFQSSNLVASGLGLADGTATDGPPLPEGVHLRWSLRRDLGFPWHGFHLFWREHIAELDDLSARTRASEWRPGSLGVAVAEVPGFGHIDSDVELVLADHPYGVAWDLAGRARLRLTMPSGEPVHLARARVAFAQESDIDVVAYAGHVPVGRATARGQAGETATVELAFDAITAIELDGGPAVLLTLQVAPVSWYAGHGWRELPGVPYPLCLPVAHPDYPTPEGLATADDARQAAVARVAAAPGGDDSAAHAVAFSDLHEQLRALVAGGPGSQPMAERVRRVLDTRDPGAEVPAAMRQHALDLVLLASLDPAAAQMLGLYHVHRPGRVEHALDYLIVADHGNGDNTVPDMVLHKQAHPRDIPHTDSWITFGHRLADPPPLEPPSDVRLYTLPDAGSRASGVHADHKGGLNRVGVAWDLGEAGSGAFWPDRPAMFLLSRARAGDREPAQAPPPQAHRRVGRSPIVVTRPAAGSGDRRRPDGWPATRLQAIDSGLEDGWYSYRVAGIDLFGRRSSPSEPGAWMQWHPPPDPRPWYYQDPPGERALHPFAVCLLDDTPPPAPVGVQAEALDPAADEAWAQALAAAGWDPVVGLRVRWDWPSSYIPQAPDLAEFHVLYRPGMLNVLRGRVVGAQAAGPDETVIETDIGDGSAEDAYAGAGARVGGRTYRIVASGGDPLWLRVRHAGPGATPPDAGEPCAVPLRRGHPRHADYSAASSWGQPYHVVGYGEHVGFASVGGQVVRRYELTLPALGGLPGDGLPLAASLDEPISYGHVGVSAVRSAPEPVQPAQPGAPPWPGSETIKAESSVSNPVPVHVVLRGSPDPPHAAPTDNDGLLASRADYHGRSFFTFRWRHAPHMAAHVLRALDDSVFQADRALRPRGHVDPADPHAFPAPPDWGTARATSVADELDALDDLIAAGAGDDEIGAAYKALSNDALRVLAALPGNEGAFSQRTIEPLDPDDPAVADRRGPDDPDDYQPDADLRAFVDEFDGRSASRYLYRAALVDPAHNRSALGPASPPVSAPNVVPPRVPAVTGILGGDRSITVAWASNREPDLAAYRVYRADDEDDAADLRSMQLLAEVAVDAAPAERPAAAQFTDTAVGPRRPYWYRLAAVDTTGNASAASAPGTGMAYDHSPATTDEDG